jgi:BolA protein
MYTIATIHSDVTSEPVTAMNTQTTIEEKLAADLAPVHLEVVNESHMHNVPAGSESHFKVTVVSPRFEGQSLVNRHRMVNQTLAEELAGRIHALALHTLTPDEWFERAGRVPDSPPCEGGSKRG